MTATASSFVYKDLLSEFGITSENVKTPSSFDRKELEFYVKPVSDDRFRIKSLNEEIDKLEKDNVFEVNPDDNKYLKAALIFTQTKNDTSFRTGCKTLAIEIAKKYSSPVFSYSAPDNSKNTSISKEDEANAEIQKRFSNNEIPLIVATKAFGMGIDKPNIRYVIHYGIPGSLDSLYQEAGRAGRDKKTAKCTILFTKDNLDEAERKILFGLDSTREQIRSVPVPLKCDLSTSLFFFMENNRGIHFDFEVMKLIIENYIIPENDTISAASHSSFFYDWEIAEKGLPNNENDRERINKSIKPFSRLQKGVYRLALLGLISDWTVSEWGEKTGILSIHSSQPNLNNMRDFLTAYIRKYEPDFDLDDYLGSIFLLETIPQTSSPIDQVILALLKWTEENILYNHRMSIKNIIELCENYENSDNFRKKLEDYFRISEVQPKLNYIADHSSQCGYWFEPFYTADENHAAHLQCDCDGRCDSCDLPGRPKSFGRGMDGRRLFGLYDDVCCFSSEGEQGGKAF